MEKYVFVFVTLALTAYGQLVMKSRAVLHARSMSEDRFGFLVSMFLDPWVLTCLAAAVLASAAWMLAVRAADLSLVYPFMALSFVFVPLLAAGLLHENINAAQILGCLLIVTGVGVIGLSR